MTSPTVSMTSPTTSTRTRVPLPALGAVVALVWAAFWFIQSSIYSSSPLKPHPIAAMVGPVFAAVAPAVMWGAILLLPPIPKLFRLRALPFAIPAVLCGALLTVWQALAFAQYRALDLWWAALQVLALTSWALAWIRLRGRPAIALLAALFTVVVEVAMMTMSAQLWRFVNGLVPVPLQSSGLLSIQTDLLFLVPVVGAVLLASIAAPIDPTKPRAARPIAHPMARLPPAGTIMPTNGMAIASLVLGVVGMSLLAVIFGHISRSTIRRTGEAGDGMAVAGLVLGYIGLSASALAVLWLGVQYLQLHY